MILYWPWRTKAHVQNYWNESYMTIGKRSHRQQIPFIPLRGAPASDESDSNSDSLETDNLKSERIYTNDFSDDKIGFYAIEAIPKRGELPQNDQGRSQFC